MYDYSVVRLRNLIRGSKKKVPEIAAEVGVSKNTLWNYLSESTPLPAETLFAVLNIIGHRIEDIVLGSPNIMGGTESAKKGHKKGHIKCDTLSDTIFEQKNPSTPKYIELSKWIKTEGEYDLNPFKLKTDILLDHQQVPVYSYEARAGVESLFKDLNSGQVMDYLDLPKAPKCDGALYASGDSMEKVIQSGDLLGFKVIQDIPNELYWGEVYILNIDFAGDDLTLIKYVQKGKDKDHILLVSENKHHADKEIHLSKVRTIALVKAVVRYKVMS